MFGMMQHGVRTPLETNWNDITGGTEASNNDLYISESMSITATMTTTLGSMQLNYVKNGGSVTPYAGAIAVVPGDRLHWDVQTKSASAGYVTVFRNGSVVIDTFNISLSYP